MNLTNIYKAVVNDISGTSGILCLHDGAMVLHIGAMAGQIKTDCPE